MYRTFSWQILDARGERVRFNKKLNCIRWQSPSTGDVNWESAYCVRRFQALRVCLREEEYNMQWCLEAADEMDQEIIRDGELATVVFIIADDLVVEEIIAASSHDVLKNTPSSLANKCRDCCILSCCYDSIWWLLTCRHHLAEEMMHNNNVNMPVFHPHRFWFWLACRAGCFRRSDETWLMHFFFARDFVLVFVHSSSLSLWW